MSKGVMGIIKYVVSLGREYKRLAGLKLNGQIIRFLYPDAIIGYCALFKYDRRDAMTIGKHVTIGPFSEIIAVHQFSMGGAPGRLTIGTGTVIGAFANIRAAGGTIEIGDNSIIGQHVTIVAANHTVKAGEIYSQLPLEERRTGVRIGSNVWIGAGVIVLPGTSVGDNSVIAAGAVVNRDVSANEVWGNIPARRLGHIRA